MDPSSPFPSYHPSDSRAEAADEAERAPASSPASSAEEDIELLRRMSDGDEAALGLIYDRWSSLVHSLVLQLLGNESDAEEVVEEVFWQAWRQCGRYEPKRGAVSTWLVMIGRSRSLDRLRSRRRRHVPEEFHHAEAFAAPADPLHDTAGSELHELILRALDRLPPEQREAIELGFLGGLSQSEIAERTGQPLGTVKTRVRLAMQKLRSYLSFLREEPR